MPVPLVGRGFGETRAVPQYRRSASTLDGWTPLPSRARPLSLVSLSAGRSSLVTPAPRVEHDASLARALATVEVPGARLSRVLQGRRLFHSGSSSSVLSPISGGSSVSPPSPLSPTPTPSRNSFGRSSQCARRRDKDSVTSAGRDAVGDVGLAHSRSSAGRLASGSMTYAKVKARDASNAEDLSFAASGTIAARVKPPRGGESSSGDTSAPKSTSPRRHEAQNSAGSASSARPGRMPAAQLHPQTQLTNGDPEPANDAAPQRERNVDRDVAGHATDAETNVVSRETGNVSDAGNTSALVKHGTIKKISSPRSDSSSKTQPPVAIDEIKDKVIQSECEIEEPKVIQTGVVDLNASPAYSKRTQKDVPSADTTSVNNEAKTAEVQPKKEKVIKKKKRLPASLKSNDLQASPGGAPLGENPGADSAKSSNEHVEAVRQENTFSIHDEGTLNVVLKKTKRVKLSSTCPNLATQQPHQITSTASQEKESAQKLDNGPQLIKEIKHKRTSEQKTTVIVVPDDLNNNLFSRDSGVSITADVTLQSTVSTSPVSSCSSTKVQASQINLKSSAESKNGSRAKHKDADQTVKDTEKAAENSTNTKMEKVKPCRVVDKQSRPSTESTNSVPAANQTEMKNANKLSSCTVKTEFINNTSVQKLAVPTVKEDHKHCVPSSKADLTRNKNADVKTPAAETKTPKLSGDKMVAEQSPSQLPKTKARGEVNASAENISPKTNMKREDSNSRKSATKHAIPICEPLPTSSTSAASQPLHVGGGPGHASEICSPAGAATVRVHADVPAPAAALDARPVGDGKTTSRAGQTTANKTAAPRKTAKVRDKPTSETGGAAISGSDESHNGVNVPLTPPLAPSSRITLKPAASNRDTLPVSKPSSGTSTESDAKKLFKRKVVKKEAGLGPSSSQGESHRAGGVQGLPSEKGEQNGDTSAVKDGKKIIKKVRVLKKKVDPASQVKTVAETSVQKPNVVTTSTSSLSKHLSPEAGQPKRRASKDTAGKPLHINIPVLQVGSKVNGAEEHGHDAAREENGTKKSTGKPIKKGTKSKCVSNKTTIDKISKNFNENELQKSKQRDVPGTHPEHHVRGSRAKSSHSKTKQLSAKSSSGGSSSESSSYASSETDSDSEEEATPSVLQRRKIREEKEREEARKLEKFRRRGQKNKLKMERLKMDDDPVTYMKNPANQRFAFLMKQEEWMEKHRQEERMKANATLQPDPADDCPAPTPIDELDDAPFDRRRGPLGGPRPKFRQYKVNDFLFLRVLGNGAFGKVMLARMHGTRNYFAVKCLRKDKIVSDEDVQDTLTERKILTMGTNHPYLCHLFCTFQTPSHLFFVLEFLNGGDLNFHLTQAGRFDADRTRFYACELVCGLRFLHKRGVIYRDLKLDNVLLDHEGHVRIADFGMCKTQIFLDRTADAFCGTVDYMAPEVVSGKNYNQSVDWWSFGIMLYEMLVGLTPFIGLDEEELFWAVRSEQPYYPRFLEDDCAEIIKWLLVKDPLLRMGSSECPAGGITSQPFFRKVDWFAVERKQLDPPFKPSLVTMADCRYFEEDFTTLPARLSEISAEDLQAIQQERFDGFDYTNPNNTD